MGMCYRWLILAVLAKGDVGDKNATRFESPLSGDEIDSAAYPAAILFKYTGLVNGGHLPPPLPCRMML